jgi:hypothetical protein
MKIHDRNTAVQIQRDRIAVRDVRASSRWYGQLLGLVTHRTQPSRYISLLIEGARQQGLPAEYVHFLQSFQLAPDERLRGPDRL